MLTFLGVLGAEFTMVVRGYLHPATSCGHFPPQLSMEGPTAFWQALHLTLQLSSLVAKTVPTHRLLSHLWLGCCWMRVATVELFRYGRILCASCPRCSDEHTCVDLKSWYPGAQQPPCARNGVKYSLCRTNEHLGMMAAQTWRVQLGDSPGEHISLHLHL